MVNYLRLLMTWQRLKSFQHKDVNYIRAFQLKQFKKLIHHAYERIPMYREFYDAHGFQPLQIRNYEDIEKAQNLYVNAITYSPIFETPNKGAPKGIDKLKEATRIFEDINIIALGGITNQEQVEKIEKTKAYGFASIRYFI